MKIQIVKICNKDHRGQHLSERAWQFSRDNPKDTLKEILEIDIPANEIPRAVIEIESTIIEREVIASMRDHTMWARGTRVDEVTNFTIPKNLHDKYLLRSENFRSLMEESKGTLRQDEYRMRMLTPIYAMTKYTVALNLRSIIKITKFFEELSCREIGMNKVYGDAAKQLKWIIVCLTGLHSKKYLEKFKYQNILPEVTESSASGKAGDFITINTVVPFTLRTHLIRHRMLMMNDGLLSMIMHYDFCNFNLETPIEISVSSSISFWKDIISKRSCWLAHYGIWSQIIHEVEKFMPVQEEMLPCFGCECPYKGDNVLRYEKKDPNPVCPIYMKKENLPVPEETISEMLNQYNADLRPIFWVDKIEEIK